MATQTEHPFKFHGSGKEFFGIWIVNILLSIITLGIYSAWAKVRTKRYFNGNTELAGHRFDYHALPMQILKGRIVVVVVLIVINLVAQLNPFLAIGVALFYMVALPWVIVRGLAFNANMTSYRNVRFHFSGTKWDAFWAYILLPILAIVTLVGSFFLVAFVFLSGASGGLGLMIFISLLLTAVFVAVACIFFPLISRANADFLGRGHSYGKSAFWIDPDLNEYRKAVFIIIGLYLAALVVYGIGLGVLLGGDLSKLQQINQGNGSGWLQVALFVVSIPLYLVLVLATTIYSAYARNNNFNNLTLFDGHRFSSTVKPVQLSWIVATNLILTIVTLTLYYPWAKVRLAKYLADNTTMIAKGDLDGFVDEQGTAGGVASGEFLDIEGFDFGL